MAGARGRKRNRNQKKESTGPKTGGKIRAPLGDLPVSSLGNNGDTAANGK
jgi:hypothetical protein